MVDPGPATRGTCAGSPRLAEAAGGGSADPAHPWPPGSRRRGGPARRADRGAGAGRRPGAPAGRRQRPGPGRRAHRGGGCEIRVVATPGHTADSVCLLLRRRRRAAHRGHRAGPRHHGDRPATGTWADYLASLDRLRALADAEQLQHAAARARPAAGRPGGGARLLHRAPAGAAGRGRAALAPGTGRRSRSSERVYADVDRALWPFARVVGPGAARPTWQRARERCRPARLQLCPALSSPAPALARLPAARRR